MSVLFGHPTGNPNSHQAALAHFEAGKLEGFCVPWFPSKTALSCLRAFPPARGLAARLERRRFAPLSIAPKIQGRLGEIRRLALRAIGKGNERLSYEANDWLMETMAAECRRPPVTAIHSYEDCSLWQFEEAKRLAKACVYDMPIGYYPAWQETERALAKQFADWLPKEGLGSHKFIRPEQKLKEMKLADLVLVPSTFVEQTIQRFTDKKCALARYGVDTTFWQPRTEPKEAETLRFLYAGQVSVRKGIPVLLQAWKQANLKKAELRLVGSWLLAERIRRELPDNVKYFGPCSRLDLLRHYQSADMFVVSSFFEGFALVLLEAMACGLPVLASNATGASDVLDGDTGAILPAGDVDAWTAGFETMGSARDRLLRMGRTAREKASRCTWSEYRRRVVAAVDPYC